MSFKDELVDRSRTANDKFATDIAKWMDENVGTDTLLHGVRDRLSELADGGVTHGTVMLLSWAMSTGDFSHVGYGYDAVMIPYSAGDKASARAMTSYMDGVVRRINRSLGLDGRLVSNIDFRRTVKDYTYSVDWGD